MATDAQLRSDTDVRRRPEQERSRAGVQAILDATAVLLDERSIDQVTMTEIAQCACCSKAAVYRYFPTKTAVVRALAEREFADQQRQIESRLDPDADPQDLLIEGLRSYVSSQVTAPFRVQLRAIIRADPELSRLDVADSRANAERLAAFLTDEGDDLADDLVRRLLLVIEMSDSVIRLASYVDPGEADLLVDQFCEMALVTVFG